MNKLQFAFVSCCRVFHTPSNCAKRWIGFRFRTVMEAREKARRNLNGVADRIKSGLATSIINKADQERSRRSYCVLGLLEATAEGDGMEEEDQKRLALFELDAAAMEATLTKVQKTVDEKTGKHFSFRTEELLLQHVQKHPGGGGSFERRTIRCLG